MIQRTPAGAIVRALALRACASAVLAACGSALLAACGSTPIGAPLSWSELQQMALPPPVERIAYGRAPQQWGELRVPSGSDPVPVLVLIHGGCWLNEFEQEYFTRLAQWVTTQGIATWNIEYRRLGDPGGGWPGTFRDVAAATDHLRRIARARRLDLDRVYAGGHSAGGQLALMLAARHALPAHSAFADVGPVPIQGVLGLAAITDLASYRIGEPDSCHSSVDPLLGGSPQQVPERYAQASPIQLLPLRVPQAFVHGVRDGIVDVAGVRAYVAAARSRGDSVRLLELPAAGHFEPAVPHAQSGAALVDALQWLLSTPATRE